jgi:hypothetical protein
MGWAVQRNHRTLFCAITNSRLCERRDCDPVEFSGLRRLLTHNTADLARFGAIIQVEPLVPTL